MIAAGMHGSDVSYSRGGWGSLTYALGASGSTLRAFLAKRLPNTREVASSYRKTVGPLVVPAHAASTGGTLGGAFDWLVRFLVDPDPGLELAATGARLYGGRMPVALRELADLIGCSAPRAGHPRMFDGPHAGSVAEPELLARGCWTLSLLTEIFRSGALGTSPLAQLDPGTVHGDDLLHLAPSEGLEQLADLRQQAEAVLLPVLANSAGPWTVGPRFEGSRIINADADLIAAGTLVELKSSLGKKRPDGTRYATLDRPTLFQLVGYTLLDFPDEYGLREILLFQARYGHVATWDVHELLDTLAGRPVDLGALREDFARFLRQGP